MGNCSTRQSSAALPDSSRPATTTTTPTKQPLHSASSKKLTPIDTSFDGIGEDATTVASESPLHLSPLNDECPADDDDDTNNNNSDHDEQDEDPPLPPVVERTNLAPEIYQLLENDNTNDDNILSSSVWTRITCLCELPDDASSTITDTDAPSSSSGASYRHPVDLSSPLHLACQRLSSCDDIVVASIKALIQADVTAVTSLDVNGFLPLHHAITTATGAAGATIVHHLITADVASQTTTTTTTPTINYLSRSDVPFPTNDDDYSSSQNHDDDDDDDDDDGASTTTTTNPTSLRSPLHHAAIRDEMEILKILCDTLPHMISQPDEYGDTPLSTLYRRYVKRHYESGKRYFPGDPSREEVVRHRTRYRDATRRTWEGIERLLLSSSCSSSYYSSSLIGGRRDDLNDDTLLRAAVSTERCPPELLRCIMATCIERGEETIMGWADPNDDNTIPLHVAARTKFASAYQSRFVLESLVAVYPDGAARMDDMGNYALNLAIESGKDWSRGGVDCIYKAYEEALTVVDLSLYPNIEKHLKRNADGDDHSAVGNDYHDDDDDEEEDVFGNKLHKSVIFQVQKSSTNPIDIISAMWAYPSDSAVQMLSCVSLISLSSKIDDETTPPPPTITTTDTNNTRRPPPSGRPLTIVLSGAIPAIVNAMTRHEIEPIVQEKACMALRALSGVDGTRDVSFAASGAIAAILNAIRHHLDDERVVEEGLGALGRLLHVTTTTTTPMARGNDNDGDDNVNRFCIASENDGMDVILAGMRAHPDERGVQKEACLAIEGLVRGKEGVHLEIVSVEVLLEGAKERFPEDCAEVVDVILDVLKRDCNDNDCD